MDIKEINEGLQQFLEKTIASGFQQHMDNANAIHQKRHAAVKKYDECVNKFKLLMMEFNPRTSDTYKTDKIYKKLTNCAWYFNVLQGALDRGEGSTVNSYLKDCKRHVEELEALF